MGRMADARKRAQRKGRGTTPPSPPPPPAEREPPAPRTWASREEPLVLPPDAPPATPPVKLSLPPSGLAEEILAREGAALAAPATTPPSPAPPPETVPARAQSVSFFTTPAREERRAAEATEHLATFFLAGEEYGVDVRLVQEIIRVTEITPLPRAPEFIKGVINLRGRIIPVVDLRRKLGLGEVEINRRARIVVAKVRERPIGLLVDGASQVLKVPVTSIEAAPEEVGQTEASYVRGVAKLEKRLIILVDLLKILAPELREGAGAPA